MSSPAASFQGRPSGRDVDNLRTIELIPGVALHAEGSCMAKFGNTHVLCTASVEERVPGWMRDTGKGWITAEYGMLPRATHDRMSREAAKGKQSGRTQEIQRLIGRALRAVTDLRAMGEIQVRLDCDVIQADGGTRTASITGAYVALHQAFEKCRMVGLMENLPFTDQVAAISCGIYNGKPVLDLDYAEDSSAQADANFVLTGRGGVVEVQATAEETPFTKAELDELLALADKGIQELCGHQRRALGLEND